MTIEKQRRERYFAVANWVIFLVGAIVVAVSIIFFPPNTDLHGVVLNIGCELIVVSVLFFFGNILLVDRQRDLEEHVERIESKLHAQSGPFLTRDQLNSRQTFAQFVGDAHDLYLAGAVLRTTARAHRSLYRERLQKGARLRFAVLDPDSPDVAAIAATWQVPTENIANDIRSTLVELRYLQGLTKPGTSGSVEIRLMKREPAFSFALRNAGSPDGSLRGDLRAFGLDTALRPAWNLRPTDDPWFQKFVQICEALWDDSKCWPEGAALPENSEPAMPI